MTAIQTVASLIDTVRSNSPIDTSFRFSVRLLFGVMLVLCVATVLFSGGVAAETVTVDVGNETVQDAIDRASSGDTVEIPGGTYNTQLAVNKQLTLTNANSDDVTLTTDEEYDTTTGVRVSSGSATIDSITIQGFTHGLQYDPGISTDDLSLTIRDLTVASNDHGIELVADNTDAEATIESVEARDNDEGIAVPSVIGGLSIEDSTIVSNDYGVAGNPETLTVTGSDINRNDEWGIDIIEAESISITDTTATQNGEADASGDNIYLSELPTDSEVTIQNVEASNANDHGISVDGPQSAVSVSDVTTNQNSDRGIYVNARSATIDGITATGNEGGVIFMNAQESEITAVDSDSTTNGIYVEGSETTLSDVTIESISEDHGIHTVDVPTVTISGATLSGSEAANIFVESTASDASISLTDITATKSQNNDGIHIDSSTTSQVDLSSITASGNSDDGVVITGGSVTIESMKVSANADVGLGLASIAEGSLSDITATGNEKGVDFVELNTGATISGSSITGNEEYEIESEAERAVEISDSTVGLVGTVDDEYVTDGVVLREGVSTANPDLESRVDADFTFDPSPPRAEETVTFDASSTEVVGGGVSAYEWDLNADGSPEATGKLAETTYQDDGVEEVTLTVVDDEGREDTKTQEFDVTPGGINAEITAPRTDVAVGEQAAIEYSVVSYLTNVESEVQMIVSNPSGVQVSSTKGLDESSNQAITTETIEPGGSENMRMIVEPTSPGEYEMEAQAIYESVDGETTGKTSQTVTFNVEEAAESPDQTTQQDDDNTGGATDDDSPGFSIYTIIIAFIISAGAVLLRQ